MPNNTAAPAPPSLHRLKVIAAAIALGVPLSFPTAARAMEDIASVDFELVDKLMTADQVNVASDGLLTAPDPERTDDTNKRDWSGPLQDQPKLHNDEDYRFNSNIPPRSYASFGEDVKAIKWEFAAVAGYYTAINAPKLLKDPRCQQHRRKVGSVTQPKTLGSTNSRTPIPVIS